MTFHSKRKFKKTTEKEKMHTIFSISVRSDKNSIHFNALTSLQWVKSIEFIQVNMDESRSTVECDCDDALQMTMTSAIRSGGDMTGRNYEN